MSQCSFPLRSGGGVILRSGSAEIAGWMKAISLLTGVPESEPREEQEASCTIALGSDAVDPQLLRAFCKRTCALWLDPSTRSFQLLTRPGRLEEWKGSAFEQSYMGYQAFVGAVLHKMLRGRPVMLMHGALLASAKGTFFFCGQSGIGKSTTSRRWQAAGGEMLSDDMALLEFCEDGVWAHPLPTWSRCAKGFAGLYYPYDPPRHLDRLFVLGRDPETERVADAAPWQAYQILYSASIIFCHHMLRHFPEDLQTQMVKTLQQRCDELAELFTPRALLANLKYDLKETLSELF